MKLPGSKKFAFPKVLPHEWAFGGFLLLTFLRLLFNGNFSDMPTAAFLLFFLVSVVLILWTQAKPTPLRWRMRLLWYPSVMGLSFYTIPAAVAALGVPQADSLLAPLDEGLLGVPAAEYFAMVQSPLFTDIMCAGYVFFFIYLLGGPGYYCIYDMRLFRACIVGMFTTYAIGFLGYTLFPAGGPFKAVYFASPLPEGPVAARVLQFINGASNGVDVFPSIHVGISLYLLMFDRINFRARFEYALLPCILLWLSTVYLRYHYLVDLAGGVVIAGIGLLVTQAYQRSQLSRVVEEQALFAKVKR